MNAVKEFAASLSRQRLIKALGKRHKARVVDEDTELLRGRLVRRYLQDLSAFLNCTQKLDLESICDDHKLDKVGTVGELRTRVWIHGAVLEAGSTQHLGHPHQPVPILLSGKLVHQGAVTGRCPPALDWPRAVPDLVQGIVREPECEPDSLEELLANADRLLGLRLGERGPDKGFYGTRIAELLGVPERGIAEPDWRGEIEIKSVCVTRDSAGWWRVKEDPAIAMEDVDPRRKLRRVLWVVRVSDEVSSPILSWYYQEWDHKVAKLVAQYLHQRPKGPKGTSNKGWYLHKRFFLYSGFLKSLNG